MPRYLKGAVHYILSWIVIEECIPIPVYLNGSKTGAEVCARMMQQKCMEVLWRFVFLSGRILSS